jgi:hypothetical protein
MGNDLTPGTPVTIRRLSGLCDPYGHFARDLALPGVFVGRRRILGELLYDVWIEGDSWRRVPLLAAEIEAAPDDIGRRLPFPRGEGAGG